MSKDIAIKQEIVKCDRNKYGNIIHTSLSEFMEKVTARANEIIKKGAILNVNYLSEECAIITYLENENK